MSYIQPYRVGVAVSVTPATSEVTEVAPAEATASSIHPCASSRVAPLAGMITVVLRGPLSTVTVTGALVVETPAVSVATLWRV